MSRTTRRALFRSAVAAPAFLQLPRQPNILMVLTDDHSAPHLGCYGNPVIRTPRLDEVSEQGMRFDRAYTAENVAFRKALQPSDAVPPYAAGRGAFTPPRTWRPPDV